MSSPTYGGGVSEPTPSGTPDPAAGVPAPDADDLDPRLAAVEADAAADAAAVGAAPVPAAGSHPVLRYTLMRFGLLLAVGAVLYVLQVRGVWLLLFAFLISGAIAMVALNRTREGAAYGITSAVRGINERIEASKTAEDDLVDAAAAQQAAQQQVSQQQSAGTGSVAPAAAAPDEAAPQPSAPTASAAPAPETPLDDWDDPAPR